MRDGARIQASIDIVERIENSLRSGGPAADSITASYLKTRRYIGSKDRREIQRHVYDVLRQRGILTWSLQALGVETSARALVCTKLARMDRIKPSAISDLFEGGYAPEPLSVGEKDWLGRLSDLPAAPAWAVANLPPWAFECLSRRFGGALGGALDEELAALDSRAPLDIRVNALRPTTNVGTAEWPEATPMRFAPLGFRLPQGTPVQSGALYRAGSVEVQDEAAQVAVSLCAAQPGEQVIDYCAGAGGKSLALAAEMQNRGQIYAFDIEPKRMAPLRERARRAGAHTIQLVHDRNRLPEQVQLVVCDVPCTGSGTWRRHPDLRWRHSEHDLAAFHARQLEILREASARVGPGGRLVYMTCSIFAEEDEAVIADFLGQDSAFTLVDYREMASGLNEVPQSAASEPGTLLMTPHHHGTDGFFVAVLRRVD